MVLALVGVRKLMDFVFSSYELDILDDIMPESKKREKQKRQTENEQVRHSSRHHSESKKKRQRENK